MDLARKKSWLCALVFFGIVFGLGGKARGQEGWKKEWEATVAAAKREGQVSVYISSFVGGAEPFQKEYPEIKLSTVHAGGGELVNRILAERRAGKYTADVVSAGALNYNVLRKAKALDPIKSTFVLPEVTDPLRWWQDKHLYFDEDEAYVIAYVGYPSTPIQYNLSLVNAKDLKSYWDLLQPKWKGRIVSYDPTLPVVAGALQFFYHHPELGPEFIRRFFGEMNVTFGREFRQITDWLASGKFSLCFTCRDVPKAKLQGLPVDELAHLKEGVYLTVGGGTLSMLDRAPHPNAAKVFVNWFLSRSGQMAVQKLGRPDEPPNSLRIDIPKDGIPQRHIRHKEGRYFVVHRPELADVTPIFKLAKEIMAKSQ
jgi:iron(III) transport system substrate-binding protein